MSGFFNRSVVILVLLLLGAKLVSILAVGYNREFMLSYVNKLDRGDREEILQRLGQEIGNPLFSGLCCHWDSNFYLEIARNGYYNDRLYAFPPAYPLLIRMMSFIDDRVIAVLISNLFSIVSLIVFYNVARIYLDERESFVATLFFSLFPTNFAYGIVAYSESMFLAFSITAWYFFEKRQYLNCGALIVLSSLSRYAGALLFPILSFIYLWKTKERRFFDLVKINALSVLIVLWLLLIPLGVSIKDVQKEYWSTTVSYPFAALNWLRSLGALQLQHVTIYLTFFLMLSVLSYRVKPELFFYSIPFILFYSSLSGIAAESIPRFLGTIWPCYLVLGRYLKAKTNYMPIALGCFIFGTAVLTLHMNWIFYA